MSSWGSVQYNPLSMFVFPVPLFSISYFSEIFLHVSTFHLLLPAAIWMLLNNILYLNNNNNKISNLWNCQTSCDFSHLIMWPYSWPSLNPELPLPWHLKLHKFQGLRSGLCCPLLTASQPTSPGITVLPLWRATFSSFLHSNSIV